MLENLDFTLFYYVGAIALVMVANTLFGIAKAQKYEEFDWATLKKGLIKYLFILLGVSFVFVAGLLLPNFSVALVDQQVTINQMLSVVAIAILGKYLVSCYNNLIEIFNVKEEVESIYQNVDEK